jgi:hypothetical protein
MDCKNSRILRQHMQAHEWLQMQSTGYLAVECEDPGVRDIALRLVEGLGNWTCVRPEYMPSKDRVAEDRVRECVTNRHRRLLESTIRSLPAASRQIGASLQLVGPISHSALSISSERQPDQMLIPYRLRPLSPMSTITASPNASASYVLIPLTPSRFP